MEKENAELRDRLEKENALLREQLDGSRPGIQVGFIYEYLKTQKILCRSYSIYNFHFRQIQNNIDGNHNDNNRRINELAAKLKGLFKDSHDGLDALNKRLLAECNGLKSLISKPLSVYFTAYRAEDYTEGGEAYLTFQGIHHFRFTLGSSRNLILELI